MIKLLKSDIELIATREFKTMIGKKLLEQSNVISCHVIDIKKDGMKILGSENISLVICIGEIKGKIGGELATATLTVNNYSGKIGIIKRLEQFE